MRPGSDVMGMPAGAAGAGATASVPALVVVPAGASAWAAQPLLGVPLLDRAVAALRAAGLRPVEVVDGEAPDGGLGAALRACPEEVVVLHDALHPVVPAELVGAVLAALASPGAVGAVPVHPVTDSLKVVDVHGDLQGTADRSDFSVVASPQAYRRADLLRAIAALPAPGPTPPGVLDLPGLVLAAGGTVVTVAAPAAALQVATPQALLLAETLLAGLPGLPGLPGVPGLPRVPGVRGVPVAPSGSPAGPAARPPQT